MKNLLIPIFFMLALALRAQDFEVGAFTGFANYQGDLAHDPIEIGETRLAVGAFARYHLSPQFKIKGSFYYGLVSGNDANSTGVARDRGWSFQSNLLEFSATGEFHPLGRDRFASGGIFKASISPYVATGLGVVNASSEVTVTRPADVGRFPEPGLKSTSIAIPFIVGIRLDAYESFSLGFEWGWRATFDDHIDGVKSNGNPDKNDWYLFIGASFAYVF